LPFECQIQLAATTRRTTTHPAASRPRGRWSDCSSGSGSSVGTFTQLETGAPSTGAITGLASTMVAVATSGTGGGRRAGRPGVAEVLPALSLMESNSVVLPHLAYIAPEVRKRASPNAGAVIDPRPVSVRRSARLWCCEKHRYRFQEALFDIVAIRSRGRVPWRLCREPDPRL
jgi:hypothetical protein